MKLPLPRGSKFHEGEDRSALVPAAARAVGWFWLAAAPVGFVAGALEFARSIQGGGLSIALPIGVGISGWALGRGLLRGNRRAWRWARRIAVLMLVGSVLLGAIVLFADPESVTVDLPWGTREAAVLESLLLFGLIAVTAGWQLLSLSSTAARAAYDPSA